MAAFAIAANIAAANARKPPMLVYFNNYKIHIL